MPKPLGANLDLKFSNKGSSWNENCPTCKPVSTTWFTVIGVIRNTPVLCGGFSYKQQVFSGVLLYDKYIHPISELS